MVQTADQGRTTAKSKIKPAAKTAAKTAPKSGSRDRAMKVPEGAENFEHTLRRLVIAKQRARAARRDD